MLHIVLPYIQSHLVAFGALGVLTVCFIDEILMFAPASVVLMTAGFVFLQGPFSGALLHTLFFKIVIPASIGLTAGSMVIYTIAYFGGRVLIERYGKWVTIQPADIDRMSVQLNRFKYEGLFIYLAWVLPLIPSILLGIFAGVTEIDARKYAFYTFIGTFTKAIIMGLVGWSLGELYVRYADIFDRFEKLFAVIVVIAVIVFIWRRKKAQKVIVS